MKNPKVCLPGVAVSPIVGQLYGARRFAESGHQLHQAVWLAIGLSLPGSTLLALPEPLLGLAYASPVVADKVRGYLLALAVALPASLLFTVYRGFNNAVSRPKAVMALQLGGLALKLPLSLALVSGVPVDRPRILAHALLGALTGLAAVFNCSRLGSADPNAGVGFELSAIAAVVVGGTSLMGGRGSIVKSFMGVLIIATLEAGLVQIGASEPTKRVVTGAVIVAAVLADTWRRK